MNYKKSLIQRLISLIIIILIIFVGLKIAKYLHKTKKIAKRKRIKEIATYVETVKVKSVNTRYKISTFGTVIPEKEITISPEVSGKIVFVNKNFYEGGYIKKGEVIVKIEDIDYKLTLLRKKTLLASLKEDLRIELGKQKSALKEYEIASKFIKKMDNESLYLILRKPYIKKIKENIKKTILEIQQAEINLNRCTIKAPFNCYILKRYANLGSFVSPGMKIADILFSDRYFIKAQIPVSDFPNMEKLSRNSVEILLDNNFKITGKLISISPVVDKNGLMASAIIEVNNNLNLLTPLKINNYTKVFIYGKKFHNITEIPVLALRENNEVWIYKKGRLKIKKVKVIFEDIKNFYTYDINPGEDVIITNISVPVENMKLYRTNHE